MWPQVSHHLADVFMDYARQSEHKPESVEEELAMLIYNYHAYFTARDIVMEPSYDGAWAPSLGSIHFFAVLGYFCLCSVTFT